MTHIIGRVISNNPCQPPYKCLWVMHWDVIQIIKHNGNNDALLKPDFLPDTNAVHSTRPTNTLSFSLPRRRLLLLHRWTLCPHHIFLLKSTYTELLGWIISFPWVFCHEKNRFISEGFRHVTASSVSLSYHVTMQGLPFERVSREEGYRFI